MEKTYTIHFRNGEWCKALGWTAFQELLKFIFVSNISSVTVED